MESNGIQKKSFDLYDYVGPGKSLYDVLAKTGLYDSSTEAMLTCAPADADAFPELSQRRFSRSAIKDCFDLLTTKAAEIFSEEEKKYIECAKIINTHGCRGAVKLESWCNTPEDLAALKTVFLLENGKYTKKKVLKASVFKQFVIAELINSGDFERHINRVRRSLRKNLDKLH